MVLSRMGWRTLRGAFAGSALHLCAKESIQGQASALHLKLESAGLTLINDANCVHS
ncbi:MAG: hypothetical protein JO215_03605 [Ktedonobacteraceae bacterium]|nr:hypothetical protein [Ktedonobacteraceae bacterium]